MFGYAAFAQPAFAALAPVAYSSSITEVLSLLDIATGGKAYADATIEAFTVRDLESVVAAFVSVVSESILAEYDAEAVVATFITSITEAIRASESSSVVLNFVAKTIENVSLADINQVAVTFNKAQTENVNLLDTPIGFAWVKIDNTESTQWVLIDNRQ